MIGPSEKATILACDDDEVILRLIGQSLRKKGYTVIEVESGKEALRVFQELVPDLILMDANMPEIDGFQICQKLRAMPSAKDIPIIMITSREDDQSVNHAFEVGAVEYITKPIKWSVLFKRIQLQIDAQRAFRQVQENRDQLKLERELIEEIISLTRQSAPFYPKGIRYLLEPVEKTAGDMLLSARSPDGTHNILLGDVTGHGLPAAIISPTVSDIVYSMTKKGFSFEAILPEINRKLRTKLPVCFFLAGCWLALDVSRRHLKVWNGGMPDVLIYRGGEIFRRIHSENLPLSIEKEGVSTMNWSSVIVEENDRVFAYSDGIVEQSDPGGNMFGNRRFEEVLTQVVRENSPLTRLQEVLDNYRGTSEQSDDITIVELVC
jgi:two-component system, HptB-dependent secretion and biofilm response regulator